MASIGVMREGPLHAAVKALLAEPGDRLEVPVGRFVIELVRADGELVTVQTGGFGALGRELDALLDGRRIRVVHPVAAERRIVRVDEDGQALGVGRSPKRATAVAVFDKLVAFPSLLTHSNLTIEVLLLREDRIRRPHPTTTRGRTRVPGERRLVEVLDRDALRTPEDILAALPALPLEPFGTRELAALLRCSTLLAQRTLYCLRMIGVVEPAGSAAVSRCTRSRPERIRRQAALDGRTGSWTRPGRLFINYERSTRGITHLGGSACHGDDARPPARRACRASPRGRRSRRRRGRRPGAPRRARRPGTLWSRQRPQPLHQRLGALRDHPFPAHAFETFAAARATALVEQIRSYKLVRDIRGLLAADQLETATYDLLARAAERAGDPDTANLAQQLGASERTAARLPHRRTRRRARGRAPRQVTASPDAA